MEISCNFAEMVGKLHLEIAEHYCMGNFTQLDEAQIYQKNQGQSVVTQIDIDAEHALSAALTPLVDNACFVGEESVASDSALLDKAKTYEYVWLVDPLDGTRNFINQQLVFSSMVSLIHQGEVILSSTYDCVLRDVAIAVKNQGAFYLNSNDKIVTQSSEKYNVSELNGQYSKIIRQKMMAQNITNELVQDDAIYSQWDIEARCNAVNNITSIRCAGRDLLLIAKGEQDFSVYLNLHPWDHAAGKLLIEESGGVYKNLACDFITPVTSPVPYHPLNHSGAFIAVTRASYLDRLEKFLCLA